MRILGFLVPLALAAIVLQPGENVRLVFRVCCCRRRFVPSARQLQDGCCRRRCCKSRRGEFIDAVTPACCHTGGWKQIRHSQLHTHARDSCSQKVKAVDAASLVPLCVALCFIVKQFELHFCMKGAKTISLTQPYFSAACQPLALALALALALTRQGSSLCQKPPRHPLQSTSAASL